MARRQPLRFRLSERFGGSCLQNRIPTTASKRPKPQDNVTWAGATPVLGVLRRPKPTRRIFCSGVPPAHVLRSLFRKKTATNERKTMKPFIPKQTKQVKDRLEVKVDTRLIARL